MLTKEAFNALLKTLEEPPAHAFFILCTTEPGKLPATIISRCQRLNFRLAKPQEIVRSLKRVVKGEKLKVSDRVLKLISQRAGGSFRDAVKVLQQLAFGGKRISLKQTVDLLEKETVFSKDLLKSLVQKDVSQTLLKLNQAVDQGADLKVLTESLLEDLRRILLQKYNVLGEKIEDYGLEIVKIKKLIFLFDQAGRQLKGAVIPQLPLELAIVEWSEGSNKTRSSGGLQSRLNRDERQTGSSGKSSDGLLRGGGNKKTMLVKWQKVLRYLKKDNHTVEALLKSTKPKEIKNDKIIIEVFYQFHKNKLESNKHINLVKKRIEQVFKEPLEIEYLLT